MADADRITTFSNATSEFLRQEENRGLSATLRRSQGHRDYLQLMLTRPPRACGG